jgi:hypothetical protein
MLSPRDRSSEVAAMIRRSALPVVAGFTSLWASVARGEPVAVVEDISRATQQIQIMDRLSTGQMLVLHPGETLVLDYLASCVRESIVGGVVSIGRVESIVVAGSVDRKKVECPKTH